MSKKKKKAPKHRTKKQINEPPLYNCTWGFTWMFEFDVSVWIWQSIIIVLSIYEIMKCQCVVWWKGNGREDVKEGQTLQTSDKQPSCNCHNAVHRATRQRNPVNTNSRQTRGKPWWRWSGDQGIQTVVTNLILTTTDITMHSFPIRRLAR